MKKYLFDFLHRGLVACGFGPVILAIVYFILGKCDVIEVLTVNDVVRGILTITLMAFIAAGITVVYQIEKLPIIWAILLHGFVLYLDYAMIYLVNNWIAEGVKPFMVFTVIFVVGFALIWLVIYSITKKSTDELNQKIIK